MSKELKRPEEEKADELEALVRQEAARVALKLVWFHAIADLLVKIRWPLTVLLCLAAASLRHIPIQAAVDLMKN